MGPPTSVWGHTTFNMSNYGGQPQNILPFAFFTKLTFIQFEWWFWSFWAHLEPFWGMRILVGASHWPYEVVNPFYYPYPICIFSASSISAPNSFFETVVVCQERQKWPPPPLPLNPYHYDNRVHKLHLWKFVWMIEAPIIHFGSKKATDTACTTSGSGHHGL